MKRILMNKTLIDLGNDLDGDMNNLMQVGKITFAYNMEKSSDESFVIEVVKNNEVEQSISYVYDKAVVSDFVERETYVVDTTSRIEVYEDEEGTHVRYKTA